MTVFYRFLFFLTVSCIFYNCARKGRPEGGPKDETAPIMVTAKPPYESTNFERKNIKLYFDEYVVLKDLNQQLVVSPPLKNPPLISPQGSPSKFISIKILDTLKKNTTYTFNFGEAIQDNNENNKLESFKYVFSTGEHIDSLTLKGSVKDILNKDPKKNINLLLYKIDSSYTDSIIYKRKPYYLTKTKDSINFEFSNLKEGNYFLIALDEDLPDYIFRPKTDKIGFLADTISIPRDSVLDKTIMVFNEVLPFNFKRGREVSKGRIQFGYEGKQKNMSVNLLSNVPPDFKHFTQFEQDKDTLNFWYHSENKLDSLTFIISNLSFLDTVTVRLRKEKLDSTTINSNATSLLHLNDTLFLNSNNPIIKIDTTKFLLTDKDSTKLNYLIKKNTINQLAVFFKKSSKMSYTLDVLPEAITDIYNIPNDSLKFSFNTKEIEDYGSIILSIDKQVKHPVIIQLLIDDQIIRSNYIKHTNEKVTFDLLEPKEYTIRAIIDANSNQIWDTGDYLKKVQPESIIYFNKSIPLRPNWTFEETFTIN